MRNNKVMLILATIAVVLVLVCGIWFVKDYQGNKPEETTKQQETTEFSLDSMNENEEEESLKIEEALDDDGFSELIPLN